MCWDDPISAQPLFVIKSGPSNRAAALATQVRLQRWKRRSSNYQTTGKRDSEDEEEEKQIRERHGSRLKRAAPLFLNWQIKIGEAINIRVVGEGGLMSVEAVKHFLPFTSFIWPWLCLPNIYYLPTWPLGNVTLGKHWPFFWHRSLSKRQHTNLKRAKQQMPKKRVEWGIANN